MAEEPTQSLPESGPVAHTRHTDLPLGLGDRQAAGLDVGADPVPNLLTGLVGHRIRREPVAQHARDAGEVALGIREVFREAGGLAFGKLGRDGRPPQVVDLARARLVVYRQRSDFSAESLHHALERAALGCGAHRDPEPANGRDRGHGREHPPSQDTASYVEPGERDSRAA